MSSSERPSLEEEQLQREIEGLRSDLGETVEALVHKADLPARARERGAELTEQAIDRGTELTGRAIERGMELSEQAVDHGAEMTAQVAQLWDEIAGQALARGNELLDQVLNRSNDWREQFTGVTARVRRATNDMSTERWAKVAGVAVGLIVITVIVRRVRTS
ncbi:MAG: DUF3618 domain-containing protein [Pseudonocardiales bacterium]|jgi:hypothetical protein|nr:DUF3618 domain-containing protein [Pseudonocardiales bacterium]MBV9650114.1 DUF3618 domain-containing protein [Pseudonocardiales bacterium]